MAQKISSSTSPLQRFFSAGYACLEACTDTFAGLLCCSTGYGLDSHYATSSTPLYKAVEVEEKVLEPKSIVDFDIVDPKKLLEQEIRHLDEKNACNTTKSTCGNTLKAASLQITVSATSASSQEAAGVRTATHNACAAEVRPQAPFREGHKKPLAAAASTIAANGMKATQALDSRDSLEDDRFPKRVRSAAKHSAALQTQVPVAVPDRVSSGCLPCCSFNLGKADALQDSKRSEAKRGRASRPRAPRMR
ncbi:g2820 [Coccomyxa elongata]